MGNTKLIFKWKKRVQNCYKITKKKEKKKKKKEKKRKSNKWDYLQSKMILAIPK